MQKFKDVLSITVTPAILTSSSFLCAYVRLGYIQIKHILDCVAFFFSQIVPLEHAQCNSSWLTL